MHTLPSPASSHTEQALARFHAMQRQLHALAAQLRLLYPRDPLARLQRQHAQDLELLQREFGDCGSRASHRRSGLRR